MESAIQLLKTISGSIHRFAILEEVCAENHGIRSISNELGIPKSTARHNLAALEDDGLITKVHGQYFASNFGEVVYNHSVSYITAMKTASRLELFINSVDMDGFEIPIPALKGAEIVLNEGSQQNQAAQAVFRRLYTSSHAHAAGTVSPLHLFPLLDYGISEGKQLTIYTIPETVTNLTSPLDGKLRTAIEAGVELFLLEQTVDFLFLYTDKGVTLASVSPSGIINAAVIDTSDNVHSIVDCLFDQYKSHHTTHIQNIADYSSLNRR